MAERTLEAMARGGIYDQLAGGFARYSVDAGWVVPHFEKMLYDNALLLRVYVHWCRLTDAPLAERIARETADFLLRDLGTAQGGFASALDADTDGVEGLTYVWTPAQLRDVARRRRAGRGGAVLRHRRRDVRARRVDASVAPRSRRSRAVAGLARSAARRAHDCGRSRRVTTRSSRRGTAWRSRRWPRPATALGEPRYLDAATACAELVLRLHVVDGRLRRTSRDGAVGDALGVAEDYGDLAEGLLALHQASADPRWLLEAGALLDFALAHFGDGAGGFFDTGDDAEQLVRRPKDPTDNAAPSGSSALANALVTYSALTGSLEHRSAAEAALVIVSGLGTRQPRFLGWALAAAEAVVSGPVQVAVVGEPGGGRTDRSGPAQPPARRRRASAASRTPTVCRCWPIARWWTGERPRTSVAEWCATCR